MMLARLLVALLVLCAPVPLAWGQGQLFNTNITLTGTLNAGTAGGTATAYTLTLNPSITAYTSNQCFTWKVHVTNTGTATLAVNGAGAKTLKKFVGVTVSDLAASDLPAGQIVLTCYDGTNMLLVGSGSTGGGGGSASFSALTSGVNSTATMTVDTGASLIPQSGGIIRATSIRGAATLPATCTVNEVYFDTDASPGQNIYGCTAPNVWTYQGLPPGGGSGLPSNPPPCPANQFVTDQDVNGTLTCAQPAVSTLSDGSSVVTLTGVQKVRNKQHVLREVVYVPDGANTITPQCDTTDVVVVNAVPANLTINNTIPTCTGLNPEPSQEMDFRFFCSASRTITWGTDYAETAGVPAPRVCTGDGVTSDYAKVRYNSRNGKMEFVATRATAKGVMTFASANQMQCDASLATQCIMRNTATAGTGVLIKNPSGTPQDGQLLMWVLRCQNAQTITYESKLIDSPNVARPTACSTHAQQYTVIGARYSLVDDLWQTIGVN